jgi:2,3-bisphosphoglycerate-independent phosphoglycerate mutase
MKTLVVVAAGAADRPVEDLGGRTPLEAAATPHLDRLAREGTLGRLVCAPEPLRAEEGAFALALFGLDPLAFGDAGATLDAAAFEVPVGSLDQAFRLSLVTADAQTILDPTAGHIRRHEAVLLLAALTEALDDPSFVLQPGDGAHNVLVWKGARDVRVETVPPAEVVGRGLRAALPRGTGIGRLLSAIERSGPLLEKHEVNELRRDLGENPATLMWPWAPGVATPLPDFAARTGRRALVVGVDAPVVGAARLQGIPVVRPDGATGLADTNLRAKTEAALEALATHDLVVLHLGALAACSESRDFATKVALLERVDGYAVGVALRALEAGLDARLVVVGGPAVSCETGRTLPDPVPFAIVGSGVRGHRRGAFTELAAREGSFEVDRPHELLDFLLHLGE